MMDLEVGLLCVLHVTVLLTVVLDNLSELFAGGVESGGGGLARTGAWGFP